MVQTLHPTQTSAFTSLEPVRVLMTIASTGHASMHHASSHWVQV